jgi:hypothetical protein
MDLEDEEIKKLIPVNDNSIDELFIQVEKKNSEKL